MSKALAHKGDAEGCGQRRVLKAEGAGPVSAEVCASVLARACESAVEEVVVANRRLAGSPSPSARESCIDVTGREHSSREQARGPSGSGAQSVPGTWGPSERGIIRNKGRGSRTASWNRSGRLRRPGTCPEIGPSGGPSPTS